ncbi:MAG: hypothetical protein FWG46_06730 [Treponema sp.]|nr:hypothetical protein [Treponema sp.]
MINDKNKQIGKNSITLNTGTINFSVGDTKISFPEGDFSLMRFPNVKADDLTPTLTIVITAVNGIPSSVLSTTGYMRIDAGDLEGTFSAMSTNALDGFVRINVGIFAMGSPASEPERFNLGATVRSIM